MWRFSWLKRKPNIIKQENLIIPETKSFLSKNLEDNSYPEILAKLALMCLILLPWLATRVYMLFEVAILKSPNLLSSIVSFLFKSIVFPFCTKILFPLLENLLKFAKFIFGSLQISLELKKKILETFLYLLVNIVESSLVIHYNLKKVTYESYNFVSPIFSKSRKAVVEIVCKIIWEVIFQLWYIYSKTKHIVSFLYNEVIFPIYRILIFSLKIISKISFSFLSKSKLLLIYFYRSILFPVLKVIKFYASLILEHSLKVLQRVFDRVFCIC